MFENDAVIKAATANAVKNKCFVFMSVPFRFGLVYFSSEGGGFFSRHKSQPPNEQYKHIFASDRKIQKGFAAILG